MSNKTRRRWILAALLAMLAGVNVAMADDSHGKTLVGSWVVVVTSNLSPFPAVDLTTVNRDGTMINTDAQFGTGHGVWKRLGDSRFAIKFMTPIMFTNPFELPPGSMLTVEGTLTVDEGGMTASGSYHAVVVDAFGGLLFPFEGAIAFQRISIQGGDD